MTRAEFNDRVQSISDLRDICDEYGLDYMDDIVNSEYVADRIRRHAREIDGIDWEEFADWVYEIPQGYEFYRHTDSDEFTPAGDFDSLKADVYNSMEDQDLFDPEEAEDEDEEYEEHACEDTCQDSVEEPLLEEDFSVDALIAMCAADITVAQQAETKRNTDERREFEHTHVTMTASSFI